MKLEPKLTLESFKTCSTLADIILKKTVKPPQNYAIKSINNIIDVLFQVLLFVWDLPRKFPLKSF